MVEAGQIRKWKVKYHGREMFFIVMEVDNTSRKHDQTRYATIRGLRQGQVNYYFINSINENSVIVEDLYEHQ